MTTTPPPMPEPQGGFNDTYAGWVDSSDFTLEQMQERDAQWMERITALEADRKMLREALEQMLEYSGIIEERCDCIATNAARTALENTK